ncbi:MAG: NAD(P)/FAD-dependent oxidoreductase, partial [Bacteriovoracaceae bacterium]|nr:NAD(P)/FAD-dependent oxidoreductase [Bacteriovoracaceae bacterium]
MKKIQIKLPITAGNEEDLSRYIKKHHPSETSYKIVSRNVDARGAAWGKTPYYVYDVLLGSENILPLDSLVASNKLKKEAPLIIGAGPAGLFCALYLVDHGVPVTLLERGSKASQRMLKISQFWRKGIIDVDDNVCFGEGGAGLFSDGKLITRVKSPYVKYVMQRLVEFGAPKEVEFVADPHVGSNKIRQILTRLTSYLEEKGCHLHFNTRVEEFLLQGNVIEGVRTQKGQTFYSPHVILAVGHSAENMYKELEAKKVLMTAKDFAIGIRIEHPRKVIDALQYGKQATSLCSLLG